MRSGEKKVLQWFIDLAKNATPLLQTPWKDLKRIAAKAAQGNIVPSTVSVCIAEFGLHGLSVLIFGRHDTI